MMILLPSIRDYMPAVYHHAVEIVLLPVSLFLADDGGGGGGGGIDQIITSFNAPPIIDNILSTYDITQHPLITILASYFLVTAADTVPFLPCQPLAIALGAKLGWVAFPITVIGQTTAGVLAFTAARQAVSNSVISEEDAMSKTKLSPEAMQKLQEFRKMTVATEEGQSDTKMLLTLIGLRLAPFFPFSAGNYLLGGATLVPLRLFFVATLFGCVLSNFVSVSVGAAGATIFF